MKKTSFQIQQWDYGWYKITRCINSEKIQEDIMHKLLLSDKNQIKSGILHPSYTPLYRMRLRDRSWFYFTVNPEFKIINGKLIIEEERP